MKIGTCSSSSAKHSAHEQAKICTCPKSVFARVGTGVKELIKECATRFILTDCPSTTSF